MGNKGAVGISINLSGTTILVINAHLAGESRRSSPILSCLCFWFLIGILSIACWLEQPMKGGC